MSVRNSSISIELKTAQLDDSHRSWVIRSTQEIRGVPMLPQELSEAIADRKICSTREVV